jgi:hypothetical protein
LVVNARKQDPEKWEHDTNDDDNLHKLQNKNHQSFGNGNRKRNSLPRSEYPARYQQLPHYIQQTHHKKPYNAAFFAFLANMKKKNLPQSSIQASRVNSVVCSDNSNISSLGTPRRGPCA